MSNDENTLTTTNQNNLMVSSYKINEIDGTTQIQGTAKDADRVNKEQVEKIDVLICKGLSRGFGDDTPPNLTSHKEKAAVAIAYGETLPVGGYHYRVGVASRIMAHSTNESEISADLEALHAMQPNDAFEVDLCTQMVVTHSTALNMLRKLERADTVELLKVYENAANKLMRTYAAQMETLRKHRGKGTQTVRHVHVNDGGQAIVADTVNHGGGGQDDER